MCFLKPHLSENPSFCSHAKDILNLTHTLFCLWCTVSYSNICRILVPAYIFLSRGEKCEYLEINLCNGDKLYWSPNVCFPWQLGFLRPGVLCFILTESCYWCFWFGSDWGEAFGKCSTVPVLFYRPSIYILVMNDGPDVSFLFKQCSERSSRETHTQHPVFNHIHMHSLSRCFCPAEEQYLRWELHSCSDSINDTFKESLNDVVPSE